MGIRLTCPNGHKLHLKSFLAGRRGICPHCGARFEIPGERVPDPPDAAPAGLPATTGTSRSVSGERPPAMHGSAAALAALDVDQLLGIQHPIPPAIDEAPGAHWYVRLTSGDQFGPAAGPLMCQWLAEERVPSDAHVWREGWADWRLAGDVFGSAPLPTAAQATPVLAEAIVERDLRITPTTRAAIGRASGGRKKRDRWIIAGLVAAVLLLVPVLIYVLAQQ